MNNPILAFKFEASFAQQPQAAVESRAGTPALVYQLWSVPIDIKK